ncbi:MAG TPA: response regulator [Longimicrobiales bacterium]|nr:response regulator [Longimicrobiales bacterium]
MSRILIVEDNPDLRNILRDLLAREYDVETARTGEDAIRLAEAKPPDAVILDLQLPAMDGVEAGRWIKTRLAPRHVPILVLTALAGPGDSDAILSAGCCDAYMAKPATLASIRKKIQELLAENTAQAN